MASQFRKDVLREGDKTNYPKKGDRVTMHYTGWLYDPSQPNNRGNKFDSSVDKGTPFEVPIGVGRVIQGWDQGVPQMSLGEKAVLTIPGNMAYGER
ncbi:uncharacterized protein HMPREF1541_01436 [Cyphellophora europaea CBS 101466]|uniref:peptidylprolyl isomerase n=1 Tax=Cyphellophora europaea (strain CBS 101466) TaxID=1220924 RepID=W2SHA1_CYPE1|nr:uncharacterized protein HMPREF1541_01436 [Cyphellophora europaea CBS 101466]ETN47244.1 hypothetical protein HMPREF1541_01436 [Cyphellophora europaea CBS 101466]